MVDPKDKIKNHRIKQTDWIRNAVFITVLTLFADFALMHFRFNEILNSYKVALRLETLRNEMTQIHHEISDLSKNSKGNHEKLKNHMHTFNRTIAEAIYLSESRGRGNSKPQPEQTNNEIASKFESHSRSFIQGENDSKGAQTKDENFSVKTIPSTQKMRTLNEQLRKRVKEFSDQAEVSTWISFVSSLVMIGTLLVGWIILFKSLRRRELEYQEIKNKFESHRNELALLGQVAGSIGHEVLNPLTVIGGTVRALERKLDRDKATEEDIRAAVRKVASVVERTGEIVNGLRKLARREEQGVKRNENLLDIVNEVAEFTLSRRRFNKVDQFEININAEIEVYCRRVQLSQVLVNLVYNAADAVVELPERWVKVDGQVLPTGVLLRVIDSGTSMSEELATNIVSGQGTTKGLESGTGLGMQLSKTIVESHGGTLGFDLSKKHTTFEIFLPAHLSEQGYALKKAA